MKRMIFTVALFLGFTSLALSQEKQKTMLTPEERAKKQTEVLSKKLSLTKQQEEKVYAANLERVKKMQTFRAGAEQERAKKMEERKAIIKESEDKIDKILTDEQRKAYVELKKERREKVKDRRHRHHEKHREMRKEEGNK